MLKVDGFKEKTVNKVYQGIHDVLQNADLATLMGASNLFGHGFGQTRCQLILDVYPNIISDSDKMTNCQLTEKIKEIDGFEEITTKQFVSNLPKFKEFFTSIKSFIKFKKVSKTTGNKMQDQIVVFTGFRDDKLKEDIINNGGQVKTSVSSNTTLLVCKDEETKNGNSSKIKDAKKKNIKIVTKDELVKMLK